MNLSIQKPRRIVGKWRIALSCRSSHTPLSIKTTKVLLQLQLQLRLRKRERNAEQNTEKRRVRPDL